MVIKNYLDVGVKVLILSLECPLCQSIVYTLCIIVIAHLDSLLIYCIFLLRMKIFVEHNFTVTCKFESCRSQLGQKHGQSCLCTLYTYSIHFNFFLYLERGLGGGGVASTKRKAQAQILDMLQA